MPFYEYQCSACGAQTEVLQKISDAPLRKCPECGKNQLKKLVSAPIFRLKGGGWYETDFKSDKDNKRNLVDAGGDSGSSETKAETSTTSDSSKKAEATPAPKAEAKPKAKSAAKPRPVAKAAGKKPAAKARAKR